MAKTFSVRRTVHGHIVCCHGVGDAYLSAGTLEELSTLIDTLIDYEQAILNADYEQEILHAEALGTHQPG